MTRNYSEQLLHDLRNRIPLPHLLRVLAWPHKLRDGRCCFLCPVCQETDTAYNPSTNLGRCFRCQRNFNPIDFVIVVDELDFHNAVARLLPLLAQQPTTPSPDD